MDGDIAEKALKMFAMFLKGGLDTISIIPDPTRPSRAIEPLLKTISTAQSLRDSLGDVQVQEKSLTDWIDEAIDLIDRYFLKHDIGALMTFVALDGSLIDHKEERTISVNYVFGSAWCLMHEGRLRQNERFILLGQ